MRECGYYWVKIGGKWEISWWDGDDWFVCGNDYEIIPDRIEEIDERRLERK